MEAKEYLEKRVDHQINWMEGKAAFNQKRYKTMKVVEIIAAALIPLLVSIQPEDSTLRMSLNITIGMLGVLIVILSSLRQLNKYQENWINYRATLESLKREKFLFYAGTPPYDDANSFVKLVVNVEALLAQENESWKLVWSQKDAGVNNPVVPPGDGSGNAGTLLPEAEGMPNDEGSDVPSEGNTEPLPEDIVPTDEGNNK